MSVKKVINSFMNRLKINRTAIFRLACNYTGIIFTVWGFISLFDPLNGFFQENVTIICKLLFGILVLSAVFVVSFIIAIINVLSSNEVRLGESSTKNGVYVKYGDMYSPDIIEKGYNGKRSVVVSVNRCFDTIVDDKLVSHKTQHGIVFQKLYDDKKFTQVSLNNTIKNILRQNTTYEELTTKEKPKGNNKRYAVGTTVALQVDENLSYYLLGLSYFDEHLNAHTSKSDFVLAVQRLIEFCNQNAQGNPVILPLLGSGLSRTKIELNNIMHYLVDAFAINKDIINNEFYIIIGNDDKDRVAIKNLRQWK